MFDRRLIVNFDFVLFISILIICCLGVANLNSITSSSDSVSSFFHKQIFWILLGIFLLFITININYVHFVRYAYYFHLFAVFLLLVVFFFGKTTLGAQRWLSLGFFTFQPSELVKMTFILALSKFYSENISQKPYNIHDLFYPFILLVGTFLPIYVQPDLGTAGIIVIIFASMLFFIKLNKKTFYPFFLCFLGMMPFFWFFLKDYQKKRVLIFLNPDLDPLKAGYQVIQSQIAVGSGGFMGKGFRMGTQSQLRFLPEQHTDFVFSVWAEEWGFVGCCFVLFFFLLVFYRGLTIAYRSKNLSGSYLAIGISFLFFFQFIINIFMTLGLFPVVGITLPFFSYGGSSMVTFMIGAGLILNIGMRKFK